MKGFVQIYTGNGKGKTTAALGITLRAVGAGFKVYIAQFMKMGDYSEIKSLSRFAEQVKIKQFGTGRFVKGKPEAGEIEACRAGLEQARTEICSGKYNLAVLDEANVAVSCGLISVNNLLELIDDKPAQTELIITGRGAAEAVIARADLVTEMLEIKHYYQQGVNARVGIEK